MHNQWNKYVLYKPDNIQGRKCQKKKRELNTEMTRTLVSMALLKFIFAAMIMIVLFSLGMCRQNKQKKYKDFNFHELFSILQYSFNS